MNIRIFKVSKKGAAAFFITAAVVVGLAVRYSVSMKGNNDAEIGQEPQIPLVQTYRVGADETIEFQLEFPAVLEPVQETTVVSRTNGIVVFTPSVGTRVARGEVVAALEDSSISRSLEDAVTAVTDAEENIARVRALTDESISQAETAVENARAALLLAEVNRDRAQQEAESAYQTARNNASIAYLSAYNTMRRALVDLHDSVVRLDTYQYRAWPVIDSQLQIDAWNHSNQTLVQFAGLPSSPGSDLEQSLKDAYRVLLSVKRLVDMTSVLLKNAVSGNGLSPSVVASHEQANAVRQQEVNASAASLLSSQSTLLQARIRRDAAFSSSQQEVSIARLSLQNAQQGLASARRSAEVQIQQAQQQRNRAQAQLDQARIRFSYLTRTAPFEGEIIEQLAEPGDFVGMQSPLVLIGGTGSLSASFSVSPAEAAFLAEGAEVRIGGSARGDVQGVLVSIQPSADPISGKVSVEASLENGAGNFRAGESVTVFVPVSYPVGDRIFVPLSAVHVEEGGAFVWVVGDDGIVQRSEVSVGETIGYFAEIRSGIAPNERVVVETGIPLTEGMKVQEE